VEKRRNKEYMTEIRSKQLLTGEGNPGCVEFIMVLYFYPPPIHFPHNGSGGGEEGVYIFV
jgi:hypothetical protein